MFMFLLLTGPDTTSWTPDSKEQILFKNGINGYQCYRIPALIKVTNQCLMAFAEGRKRGCNDFGDVDLLMKISHDGGATWGPYKVLVDYDTLQAGNPAPMVDFLDSEYPLGRIFLFYNTGTTTENEIRNGNGARGVHYITYTDQGQHWSIPQDISKSVHFNQYSLSPEKDWRTHANTPGHALQFDSGPFKNRIYVPANHSTGPPQNQFNEYHAYGFYSDDHGKTWKVSEDVPIPSSNEAIGVLLNSGEVMLNIRQQSGATKRRLVARSTDGGVTWDEVYFDDSLISPVCQSSLILFKNSKDTLLIYSGPNSTDERIKMTLKASRNEGASWPFEKEIYAGISAYSDLVQLDDSTVGLFYEKDDRLLTFLKIPLNSLLQ